MNEIYIIFRNFDDYDLRPYAIGFAESEDSASALCVKFDSYQETSKEVGERASEVAKPFWDEDLELESGSDWPRWRQGINQKDITVEMREERNSIQEENKRVGERNSVKTEDRNKRMKKAVSEFIDGLGYDEELMTYIRKMVEDTGGCSYLLPYTKQKINKL